MLSLLLAATQQQLFKVEYLAACCKRASPVPRPSHTPLTNGDVYSDAPTQRLPTGACSAGHEDSLITRAKTAEPHHYTREKNRPGDLSHFSLNFMFLYFFSTSSPVRRGAGRRPRGDLSEGRRVAISQKWVRNRDRREKKRVHDDPRRHIHACTRMLWRASPF